MLDEEVGYIWLYRFDKDSAKNFVDAVNDLNSQGMKGLVLICATIRADCWMNAWP